LRVINAHAMRAYVDGHVQARTSLGPRCLRWPDWPGTTARSSDLLVHGHCPAQLLGSAERRFFVPAWDFQGSVAKLRQAWSKTTAKRRKAGFTELVATEPRWGRSGVQHAPTPNSVEAIFFMTRLSKWEKTGQLRPYVRPVMRDLPLAIMGVRLRVRHQSVGRAQGTFLLSVLPKLYVLDYRLSHHAV
jgi:hypothetical protein